MLSNLSLKSRLIFICLVLSSVSCVIGGISYVGSRSVSTSYDNVSDRALPNLQHLNDMFLYFRDIRINLRTLGLPDLSVAEQEKHIKQVVELIGKFEETDKLYRAVPFTPEQEKLYSHFMKEWGDFKEVGGRLLALQKEGTPEAMEGVKKIILVDCPASAAEFTLAIDALKQFHNKEAAEFVSSAKTRSETTNTVILLLVAVGIIGGLAIGTIFSNKITKKISTIASQLMDSSKQTSIASAGLMSSSVKLSEGSTESAASLEETVSALEELSSQVKLNSEHAKEANSLSQASHKSAEQGKTEISKLINAMSEMTKSSKKIEEIINVIDDIAFQTNLLALNAAVEAARAGDQGKGFAVVADAVRNLAGRSSVAAKDISTLIKENVQMTSEGSKIAGVSGEALIQIVTSVKKVADLNSEIAHASTEQAHGIEQISRAMNLLDSATQSNAVTSQEVSSSAEKMSFESSNLVGLADELSGFIQGNHYKSFSSQSNGRVISIYDHGRKEDSEAA